MTKRFYCSLSILPCTLAARLLFLFIGFNFLASPLQAAPDSDSGLSISFGVGRSVWEPAVRNEIDKMRAASNADYLFLAGITGPRGQVYEYGSEREILPMGYLSLGFRSTGNRDRFTLGAGSSSSDYREAYGLDATAANSTGFISPSQSTKALVEKRGTLERYTLNYEHEYNPWYGADGPLGGLGFTAGLNIVRDTLRASYTDFDYSSSVVNLTGMPMVVTGLLPIPESMEQEFKAAELTIGVAYRISLAESLALFAGASVGKGKGENRAELNQQSFLFSGGLPLPIQWSYKYDGSGDIRSSRFHLGLDYSFSENVAMSASYRVTNRYYTPTKMELPNGFIVPQSQEPYIPLYLTQKDKSSEIRVEVHYRM